LRIFLVVTGAAELWPTDEGCYIGPDGPRVVTFTDLVSAKYATRACAGPAASHGTLGAIDFRGLAPLPPHDLLGLAGEGAVV
jgi:hypothetical protein